MNRFIVFITYLILGFGLYFPSLDNGFILDDEFQILGNPQVVNLSQIWGSWTNSTMAGAEGVGGIYYKPMMMMAYNLLWNSGGGSPLPFHLFQITLHILNAFFVFLLFQRLIADGKKNMWAIFAGAIFLCHPINSEAVVMIADLQEPLYTLFGLSGLLMIMAKRISVATGVLLLLSLLSKESGIQYLCVGLLYCFVFEPRQVKAVFGLIGVVMAVYLGLRFGIADLQELHANNMQINRADLVTRMQTLPKILTHYLAVFALLAKPSLTQDWIVSELSFVQFWYPLLVVVLTLAAITFAVVRHPRREFIFLLGWLFIGLGLHSQLVPLDGTVSDRWFYFSIVGATGIFVVWLQRLFSGRPNLALVVIVPVVLLLSVRTNARVEVWESQRSLYAEDLLADPDSFYLNNNMGLLLLEEQKYHETIPYLEKTIAVAAKGSREWLVAWRNLGAVYLELKDFPRAENCFRIALADPDVKSLRAMVYVLERQGRVKEMREMLEMALKKYPNDRVLIQFK